MVEANGGVHFDLSRANGDILRRQTSASSTTAPQLIQHDSRSATLLGPWGEPWNLTRPDWIAVVAVLVDAWHNNQQKLDRATIERRSGTPFRNFPELFRSAPEWTRYIRGADKPSRART